MPDRVRSARRPADPHHRGHGPGTERPFQRPGTTTTSWCLRVWQPGTATATTLPTINDLALGPTVASTPSLTRTGHRTPTTAHPPGDQAAATAAWQITDEIPGGRNARPEGLTFLPSAQTIIGIDTEQPDNNLVVLQALNGR